MTGTILSVIRKLSADEAQKIAAGEVVERPANVVKELVENSLDAGATHIAISLESYGKSLIEVVDNGQGMSEQDAQICFESHATSKITSVDDLDTLSTFGFRGEALTSIAAISRVTLTTRDTAAMHATQVTVEGGSRGEPSTVCAPKGTSVIVRDLFYNVPARKKFLKSNETEGRQIVMLLQAFALAHPALHFSLMVEERSVLNCPGVQSLDSRISQLWAHGFASCRVTVEKRLDNMSIYGCVSSMAHCRYDRSNIFLFVNRRWVKNSKLSSAVIKGYLNLLPEGKFPSAALFIEVAPNEVDINVHPRKEEVKFLHPRRVEALICSAIKEALNQSTSTMVSTLDHAPFSPILPAVPDTSRATTLATQPQPFVKPRLSTPELLPPPPTLLQWSPATNSTPEPLVQQAVTVKDDPPAGTILGYYHKTYVLIEQDNGVFFVDVHAAHERILYEQFGQRFTAPASTSFLFPPIVQLTADEYATVRQYQSILHDSGIFFQEFGICQVRIDSAPLHLKEISFEELFKHFAAQIRERLAVEEAIPDNWLHTTLRAQMACKAAVKAGYALDHQQLQEMLEQLQHTPNRFTCPHGRPTGWLLPLGEIERKFRRKK